MKYCTRCVMRDTKPDLFLDEEGVCNACRSVEKRKEINWESRKEEFFRVFEKYRSKDSSNWDCIIPVRLQRMLLLSQQPVYFIYRADTTRSKALFRGKRSFN